MCMTSPPGGSPRRPTLVPCGRSGRTNTEPTAESAAPGIAPLMCLIGACLARETAANTQLRPLRHRSARMVSTPSLRLPHALRRGPGPTRIGGLSCVPWATGRDRSPVPKSSLGLDTSSFRARAAAVPRPRPCCWHGLGRCNSGRSTAPGSAPLPPIRLLLTVLAQVREGVGGLEPLATARSTERP